MPASSPRTEPAFRVSRVAAYAMVLAAVGTVLGASLGLAFVGKLPKVVIYANIGAAIGELGLVIGLLRRRRAAWAFALSLGWTLTIVNLLALPHLARGGTVGYVSIAFVVARTSAALLLSLSSSEFKENPTISTDA